MLLDLPAGRMRQACGAVQSCLTPSSQLPRGCWTSVSPDPDSPPLLGLLVSDQFPSSTVLV